MSCVNLKNNRYKIIHTYNANVYRVMDELSTCVYILKICPDYETKRYKHQFKTEINVLSNLNSIHVPSLITCFEEDFAQCFVETYIPGINARQYFQNHRCLFKKYRLLIDVLKVLQDLHQIGYLYIDLKLENIIYYQNHFYLIDFNACIENHSHVAVMASKSNCAPELLTLNEKDIRCDIYALGSLIQELFGISMMPIVLLCHQKQERRISRLSTFKNLIFIHIIIRILLVLSICILSVFRTSPKSVIDAYYIHHQIALFEKAYKESDKKDRLYTWISNGWILDEVYVNEQASLFLMEEAIVTKDATLIRYVYDRVSLDKWPELQALVLVYLNPDAAHIDTCVKLVNSNNLLLKDKLNVLNQCLQFGLHKEIKISIQPIKDWIESINPETLKTYQAEFENLGCNYLEYVLLLRNKESENMEIPVVFIDNLKSERWKDLYEFWRSL